MKNLTLIHLIPFLKGALLEVEAAIKQHGQGLESHSKKNADYFQSVSEEYKEVRLEILNLLKEIQK